MLTEPEKYSLIFRTGIVAGVFSFVVGMLMLVDYGGRVSEDPLNSPKFQAVRQQLDENQADEALKQEIRKLDLQLRQEYFQHRWLTQWGAWLLLGGIVATLVCAKTAGTIRRRLPHPHPSGGPDDVDEFVNGISRWSIAALALATALCTLGMYVGFRSVLPPDEQQLTVMLDESLEFETSGLSQLPDRKLPPAAPTPEQPDGADGGGESSPTDLPEPGSSTTGLSAEEQIDVKNTWPRFRGSGGLGISAYTNLPTTWNGETGEGVRWKTPVPLPGNSSPVVWGKRVFLTGATEEERVVFCFDADSGEILWRTAAPTELEPAIEPPEVGETTGFAACTPATDGQRVYAMFANGDLVGIDFEGNVVWSRSLGVPDNIYGHAASLTTCESLLIVQLDQGSKDDGKSRLLGVNNATGETVWETVREVPNSWTTPIVIQHEGQPQIITAADPWVIAYSPADGKELWRVECLQADVGPSPVFADGVVYSANEFPGAAAIRVPAAAGADGTAEAEVIWEADIGAPDCSSPLVTDEFVLLLASYGTLTCYDAREGVDPLWEEDFDDSSFTSSPTLAGSLVYLFGEEGLGYVVEPTAEACKRIAESNLGEGCVTSPAFQEGRIYIRGAEHLFCIESESADVAEESMPGTSTTDSPVEEQVPVDSPNTWPRFRGPGGLGVSAYTNLPTTWNGETGEGVRWKTPVPLPGNSSPVVWGKRVFLTGATEEERVVFCFDADSGEILWRTAAPTELDPATEPPEVGETTGFAACTPATDGQRVYAMFANGDLVGIDFEGDVDWSRSLGVPDNIYGHAASLTTYENLLIVQLDQGSKDDGKSRLLGVNNATGETVWETVREVPNSWTTPIVIQHEGQPQIITAADPWVIAYSPADGKELWRVECLQADVGPSPVFVDGVVYSANEFPGAAAIRVPAAGASEAEVIWEADIGAPDCSSPLVTDEFVLLLASYGTLTCYDAREGVDPLWEEDFDDSSFTSSPTLAGSLVYLFGEEGLGYVVEPTAEACKRIAESNLGEGCVTSPAFQEGRIYIRGAEYLFCIESESADVADESMPGTSTTDSPFEDQVNADSQDTWPRFRGPGGLGISAYTNLPTTWNGETGEGVRWKTPVPLPGNSSPVVWGKRVFLTGATEEERVVFCFDGDSGEILWRTAAPTELDPATEPPEVGETTGFAACTPATDGQRVYAMFANGDVVGIDFEGNVAWSRSLGVPDNIYGHAASLTTYENLLIVQLDQGSKDDGKSRLLGVNCATGETVWETVREVPNSWTTPIVIQHEGQPQIITAADPWVIAYSPADGKELWRVECLQADVGPSPVFVDGVVYSANEFPGAAAIRVPAVGASETEIIWEADIGAPDCSSPLVTDEFVLLLASYGTLTCYDAREGVDPLWEEDFDDSSFISSPTLAGSRVYLFGEEGLGYVVEPTADECKRIAESNLGEGCVTSPAFQDGRIYIRGAEHLFCIGAKSP